MTSLELSSPIRLADVYKVPDAPRFLYELLAERDPIANISHKKMPSWQEHWKFIASEPYKFWGIVMRATAEGDVPVGACYLSKWNEIGIQIARAHQRRGYAETAVRLLIERFKDEGRLLANIAPNNTASAALFRKLGFGGPIQHTYSMERI